MVIRWLLALILSVLIADAATPPMGRVTISGNVTISGRAGGTPVFPIGTFVATTGNDTTGTGSEAAPYATLNRAITHYKAVLGTEEQVNKIFVSGGSYVGFHTINSIVAPDNYQLTITEKPGTGSVRFDGMEPGFNVAPNALWTLNTDPDAHPDEYITVGTYPAVNGSGPTRAAFIFDTDANNFPVDKYNRVFTYGTLEDLRATNQTWGKIYDQNGQPLDPREGPEVVIGSGGTPLAHPVDADHGGDFYRFPWCYYGPGIWWNSVTEKIHARFSWTHHTFPGAINYEGETDPNLIPLAISYTDREYNTIVACTNVAISNVCFRFGGGIGLQVHRNYNVTLAGVHIYGGGEQIVAITASTNTVFTNSVFDGGLPPWCFRSDIKGGYSYITSPGVYTVNQMVSKSLGSVQFHGNNLNTYVANCEVRDMHDIYISSTNTFVHHSLVTNLHDEALFLDIYDGDNIHIYKNAILASLSPLSFAGFETTGKRYIYRNLVDVTVPTFGYRPTNYNSQVVNRYGTPFKHTVGQPPYDVFQNTFIVYNQEGQAAYTMFADSYTETIGARRNLRNIYVQYVSELDAGRIPSLIKAITFLPSPTVPAVSGAATPSPILSDANYYYRRNYGSGSWTVGLRYSAWHSGGGTQVAGGNYNDLAAYLAPTPHYTQSIAAHTGLSYGPDGYEANSVWGDPGFMSEPADGQFNYNTTDWRISPTGAARHHAKALPADLLLIDQTIAGEPDQAEDAVGAFSMGTTSLNVGKGGRFHFPD